MTWGELCKSGGAWVDRDDSHFIVVHNGTEYLSKQFKKVFVEYRLPLEIKKSKGFNVGGTYNTFKLPGEFLI